MIKKGITVIHKIDRDMVDYPTAEAAARATHQTAKTVQDIAAGNETKLKQHANSAHTPNELPFRTLYQTAVPVYLRASEDAKCTQQSVELALVKAGKARRKANKDKTNKASLSNADIADILVECIPMFAR